MQASAPAYRACGEVGTGERVQQMSLAYRNLFQDKIRLALSMTGVALATVLILLLNGF